MTMRPDATSDIGGGYSSKPFDRQQRFDDVLQQFDRTVVAVVFGIGGPLSAKILDRLVAGFIFAATHVGHDITPGGLETLRSVDTGRARPVEAGLPLLLKDLLQQGGNKARRKSLDRHHHAADRNVKKCDRVCRKTLSPIRTTEAASSMMLSSMKMRSGL